MKTFQTPSKTPGLLLSRYSDDDVRVSYRPYDTYVWFEIDLKIDEDRRKYFNVFVRPTGKDKCNAFVFVPNLDAFFKSINSKRDLSALYADNDQLASLFQRSGEKSSKDSLETRICLITDFTEDKGAQNKVWCLTKPLGVKYTTNLINPNCSESRIFFDSFIELVNYANAFDNAYIDYKSDIRNESWVKYSSLKNQITYFYNKFSDIPFAYNAEEIENDYFPELVDCIKQVDCSLYCDNINGCGDAESKSFAYNSEVDFSIKPQYCFFVIKTNVFCDIKEMQDSWFFVQLQTHDYKEWGITLGFPDILRNNWNYYLDKIYEEHSKHIPAWLFVVMPYNIFFWFYSKNSLSTNIFNHISFHYIDEETECIVTREYIKKIYNQVKDYTILDNWVLCNREKVNLSFLKDNWSGLKHITNVIRVGLVLILELMTLEERIDKFKKFEKKQKRKELITDILDWVSMILRASNGMPVTLGKSSDKWAYNPEKMEIKRKRKNQILQEKRKKEEREKKKINK